MPDPYLKRDVASEIRTLISFGGHDGLYVGLSVAETSKLINEALQRNTLLEFQAEDGESIVINPFQVQTIRRPKPIPPR